MLPWWWQWLGLLVREITKISSTFCATNISSNMIWFLQLHDTIKMKYHHTGINYNHNNIAIRSHIMIYSIVQNLILLPNFVAFISQKDKNVWFFNYHLLTCGVRKMVLICLMQNIDMFCINLIKSHAWCHTSSVTFSSECLPCIKKMLLNLVAKMKFHTSFYIIK